MEAFRLRALPRLLLAILVLSCNGIVIAQDDKPEMNISDEAMEIHQAGMLFDGHNDLPFTMRMAAGNSFDQVDIAEPTEFHTDIPRLRAGGLKAQFWSVYVPASTDMTGNATVMTFEQIRLVQDMCERYPDVFEMADTAADVRRIIAEGKIASMCGVEGGHSIQNSLQTLREMYDQGVRYMTLTHSKTLGWADSATDEPKNNGLSPFGQEVVREMNRIGMLVDLSHVSEKCMKDALEIARAPVIFSHSSAKAICDHPRNVSDEVLELVRDNGGVVMVNFMSGYIVPTEELEENENARGDHLVVCDHIEHIINVAGIDHVGIGSDYDGVRSLPVGLDDVSYYPNITQELLNRGYDREQIHKILGGNVLRALEEAENVAAEMSAESQAISEPETLFTVSVTAGERDRVNELVTGFVDPGDFQGDVVTLSSENGDKFLAQLSEPSASADIEQGMKQLSFVLNALDAGQTLTLKASDGGLNTYRAFEWHDDQYGTAQLMYHGVPVMDYMYEPLDESRRGETYKVFHHVYDPDGLRRITKGPGGLYPHHRGLYYGFNRISYGENQRADTWHCNNGESQTHEASLLQVAGAVIGRDVNIINWRGQDGEPFAQEIREMTVSRSGGATIIDFYSSLDSLVGDVRLDGDPQHAGFQFRAAQDVPDKTRDLTYYIRPDGRDEPGSFRNWSAGQNESEVNRAHIDLAWNALCFALPVSYERRGNRISEDRTHTVGYLDHPDNPKPARFSERDYGRFGSYFEYDLKPGEPLTLRYRVVIMQEAQDVETLENLSGAFLNPALLEQME
ncbi:MAG: membrane dipeptidase [Planctomycetota bacterium]